MRPYQSMSKNDRTNETGGYDVPCDGCDAEELDKCICKPNPSSIETSDTCCKSKIGSILEKSDTYCGSKNDWTNLLGFTVMICLVLIVTRKKDISLLI